jgi:hypothetical protein
LGGIKHWTLSTFRGNFAADLLQVQQSRDSPIQLKMLQTEGAVWVSSTDDIGEWVLSISGKSLKAEK